MGNLIAALALLVSMFGAGWVAYQDSGRWRRLERYGTALQAARPGSLERAALQSVFNQLSLPLALEALAPARKALRHGAWVAIDFGLVIEGAWVVMVAVGERGRVSWTVYGVSLIVLGAGVALRGRWRESRQQWMREEMQRRHAQLETQARN